MQKIEIKQYGLTPRDIAPKQPRVMQIKAQHQSNVG